MTINPTLVTRVENILDRGLNDASLLNGSLEKMSADAGRNGDTTRSQQINNFLALTKEQIGFFRDLSDIRRKRFFISRWVSAFHKATIGRVFRGSAHPLLDGVNGDVPFSIIEGYAVPDDPKKASISGPFFIAATACREGRPKAYLFSQETIGRFSLIILDNAQLLEVMPIGKLDNLAEVTILAHYVPDLKGSIHDVFGRAVLSIAENALPHDKSDPITAAFLKKLGAFEDSALSQPKLD